MNESTLIVIQVLSVQRKKNRTVSYRKRESELHL
jgi:hypothetical protein